MDAEAETRSDVTQGVFGYMAFYADFGEQEHVFSPVSCLGLYVPDYSDVGVLGGERS